MPDFVPIFGSLIGHEWCTLLLHKLKSPPKQQQIFLKPVIFGQGNFWAPLLVFIFCVFLVAVLDFLWFLSFFGVLFCFGCCCLLVVVNF